MFFGKMRIAIMCLTLVPLCYAEVLQTYKEQHHIVFSTHIILGNLGISKLEHVGKCVFEELRFCVICCFQFWKLFILECWNFEFGELVMFGNTLRSCETLEFWNFGTLKLWNFEIWNFEISKTWHLGIAESWKLWILETFDTKKQRN